PRHRCDAPRGRRIRARSRGRPRTRTQGADAVTATLITNIGELTTNAGPEPLRDAAVLIEHDRIAWVGSASDAPAVPGGFAEVDASGRAVVPGFVDSHSH